MAGAVIVWILVPPQPGPASEADSAARQRLPLLLLPSLNSTGAEAAGQSRRRPPAWGVSTSSYVCREGEVIRHNFGWTLVILGYLILIGLFYYSVLPEAMRL